MLISTEDDYKTETYLNCGYKQTNPNGDSTEYFRWKKKTKMSGNYPVFYDIEYGNLHEAKTIEESASKVVFSESHRSIQKDGDSYAVNLFNNKYSINTSTKIKTETFSNTVDFVMTSDYNNGDVKIDLNNIEYTNTLYDKWAGSESLITYTKQDNVQTNVITDGDNTIT